MDAVNASRERSSGSTHHPRFPITVNFFPRLMPPLLHGRGNLFFQQRPTFAAANFLLSSHLPLKYVQAWEKKQGERPGGGLPYESRFT